MILSPTRKRKGLKQSAHFIGHFILPYIFFNFIYSQIISDMDSEIASLESKLEKYRNIKLGMMQNLLTGKIRLV
jgi:type I restriction enzyme S subunit